MKFEQKNVAVNPVILTFDEAEMVTLKNILDKEPKKSVLLTSYESPNRFIIIGDDLYSFWDRIDNILGTYEKDMSERRLLLSVSNSMSDFVQFNKQA